MKIDQFELADNSHGDNRPSVNEYHAKMEEDSEQIPEPGNKIRTKKMQMEGTVERVGQNRAGHDEVFFRLADGRLMKTPLENVIVVEKLADDDMEVMEDNLNEISDEVLAKYKAASGKSASEADARGDFKKGDKRFSGIVRATKKQFSNDAKKKTEGSMGGINRCAPSSDVSYQHVLDKNKVTPYSRVIGETYEEKLANILKEDDFSKAVHGILGKQHKETQVAKKSDVKYMPSKNTNFTIRFRPQTDKLTSVKWQVLNSKKEIVGSGNSDNDKDAYNDAEDWIATSNQGATANSNVTVNFNAAFAREIAPEGNTLWVDFWEGPIFVYSDEPQEGFRKTVIRTQAHSRTAGTALLPVTTVSPKEANKVGLKADIRYTLGPRQELDNNVYGFPLNPHSRVEKGTMVPIKEPSITTSQSQQSLEELDKPTLGSYIKKASRDVADISNGEGFRASRRNPKYNTSDDTPKEIRRHDSINRAVDKLSK